MLKDTQQKTLVRDCIPPQGWKLWIVRLWNPDLYFTVEDKKMHNFRQVLWGVMFTHFNILADSCDRFSKDTSWCIFKKQLVSTWLNNLKKNKKKTQPFYIYLLQYKRLLLLIHTKLFVKCKKSFHVHGSWHVFEKITMWRYTLNTSKVAIVNLVLNLATSKMQKHCSWTILFLSRK